MREDGLRDKEAWEATVEENPAALVKRLSLSRHEAIACGDPGKDCETEAGAGGLDEEEAQLEGPATSEEGRETMVAEASTEPLR